MSPYTAAGILGIVEDLRKKPRCLVGDDILRLDGPGGMWRIRVEYNPKLHPNRAPAICVYNPNNVRYFSVHSLRAHLATIDDSIDAGGDGDGDGDGDAINALELYASMEEVPALHMKAAYRIQRMWFASRWRAAKTKSRRLFAEIHSIEDRLSELAAQLRTRRELLDAARFDAETLRSPLLVVLDVENEYCKVNVHGNIPTFLRTVDAVRPVVAFHESHFQQESGFTRENLRSMAETYVRDYAETDILYMCGKSMLKEPHYPVILGSVAVPTDKYRLTLRGARVDIHHTIGLSGSHREAIARAFSSKWATACEEMIHDRSNMGVYDFYEERKYIGSIILSKFIAREKGLLVPVVSIDSIVAHEKNSGAGSIMFEFAKKVAFSDFKGIRHVYMFAQCLPNVKMWEYSLDIGNAARALVLQLHFMYSSYHIEKKCIMRYKTFDSFDESPVSPAKKCKVPEDA